MEKQCQLSPPKETSEASRETELQKSPTPEPLIRKKWRISRKRFTLWMPLESLPLSQYWPKISLRIRSSWHQWTNKTQLMPSKLTSRIKLQKIFKQLWSQLRKSPLRNIKPLLKTKPLLMPRQLNCRKKLTGSKLKSTQRLNRETRILQNSKLNWTQSSPSKPNSNRIRLMSTLH